MSSEAIFVRKDSRHFRIPLDCILFAKAEGSYLTLTTSIGQFSLAQNLSQFLRSAPVQGLVRVHRSYLINMEKVEAFDNESVWINKVKIPISKSRRREFLDRIHCI